MKEISNCEVITVPDEKVVNKAVAFVVPSEGQFPTDELKNKIISYCQMNVPEYMVPSEIIYLDSIPLNASKKPDLKELEKIYNDGITMNVGKTKKKFFRK